jgi:hypothetical protein
VPYGSVGDQAVRRCAASRIASSASCCCLRRAHASRSEVSRRAGVPPTLRANEHAVQQCSRAATHGGARLAHERRQRSDAAQGGRQPCRRRSRRRPTQDRRTDLALKYDTPLQQACKWPPLRSQGDRACSQAELAKLPPLADRGRRAEPTCRRRTRGNSSRQFDVEFHNSRYQTYLHFAAEAKRADLVEAPAVASARRRTRTCATRSARRRCTSPRRSTTPRRSTR